MFEPEELKGAMMGGILLIFGIIVMIICLKIFVFDNQSGKKRLREKAKANGSVTTAHCIKSRIVPGDKIYRRDGEIDYEMNATRATYEYTVGGKKYKEKLTFHEPGSFSTPAPDDIKIYYDANRPRRSTTDYEVEAHRSIGCIWTFLITVGSMILLGRILTLIFGK